MRSRLSIIPQAPFLFAGTLRSNLDPFGHYTDQQCLDALESVQMKLLVTNHPQGLNQLVNESGSNLSAGQCQLICVARAILKDSRILLTDEATANVDQATDQLLQNIFNTKFHDRTILTIAHRLDTVARSDRILVMHEGTISDFDTPEHVLSTHGVITSAQQAAMS